MDQHFLEVEEDEDAASRAFVLDAQLVQLNESKRYRGRADDIRSAQTAAEAAWGVVVRTAAALRVAKGSEGEV